MKTYFWVSRIVIVALLSAFVFYAQGCNTHDHQQSDVELGGQSSLDDDDDLTVDGECSGGERNEDTDGDGLNDHIDDFPECSGNAMTRGALSMRLYEFVTNELVESHSLSSFPSCGRAQTPVVELVDVDDEDAEYIAVHCMVYWGLFSGLDGERFHPDVLVDRATFARVMHDVLLLPSVGSPDQDMPFEDVPEGVFFHGDVLSLFLQGLTPCRDEFRPRDPVDECAVEGAITARCDQGGFCR